MRSIDEYDGWPTLRAALQLIALTMTRPGELRGMKRNEINFDKGSASSGAPIKIQSL
jgi:integrase